MAKHSEPIRQREMDKIEIQKNMDDEIFETISKIEEIKLRKELFVSQMNRLLDKKFCFKRNF